MISIIDYGMGNLASVEKALNHLGFSTNITNNHDEIRSSNAIILPGVGSFQQGMENLKRKKLDELLTEEVILNKKPFLGICLGMQLILEFGSEPQKCKGLGWIEGEVVKMNNNQRPVPHLGWNKIYSPNDNNVNDDLNNNFYFIHSFHAVPNEDVIDTLTMYEFEMVASIRKENIFATQFHPEKSQKAGLELLKKYFEDVES